jgi:glutathione synthase/RimK-type ligase-like ATP-grasp enzyme
VPRGRTTPRWVAARATNRFFLTRAYGSSYLSEYRRLVEQFKRRPKTVLNEIWTSAAAEVGATVSGDWDSGFAFQLGTKHARVDEWETHLDPPQAIVRALDKPVVAARLAEAQVAVPEQISFSLRESPRAAARLRQDGGRWVLKPRAGASGMGVTCGLERPADLARGLVAAAAFSGEFVLERQLPGDVYRFLVLDGEVLDVVRRDPSSVEGDGASTIRELIRSENTARVEANGERGNQLVQPDHDCLLALRSQQVVLASVPPAGARYRVKHSNGDGGRLDTHRVPLSVVSPELAGDVTRAVASVGLRLAGVDVVTPDLSRGLAAGRGAIVDVNAPPGLHYHYLTADGVNPVAIVILRRLLAV